MSVENYASPLKMYGYGGAVAYIRFVPGASPTIQERWGVKTLTRGGAGDYTITLNDKWNGLAAYAQEIDNGTTTYNKVNVESTSVANSTVTVSCKVIAYANVASGPAASDAVDAIQVFVFCRGQ